MTIEHEIGVYPGIKKVRQPPTIGPTPTTCFNLHFFTIKTTSLHSTNNPF
jgi:hypothetical protein